MTKGDLARQNFKSGYNCSQAVALAFQDKIGMDPDTIARLTIGFGGGMGRMREVCGMRHHLRRDFCTVCPLRRSAEKRGLRHGAAGGKGLSGGDRLPGVPGAPGAGSECETHAPGGTPHGGLLQKASLRRIMRPGRRPFRRLFKKYHLKGLHFAMRCAILFEQKRSSAFAYALVAQLDRVSGYEPEGRGFESLPAYQ